jgi:hypothetical protein
MSLKALTWEATATPPGVRRRVGNPPMIYYGWIWFYYGKYAGDPQEIKFAEQIFYPTHPEMCTGYGWIFEPGTTGILNPFWTYVDGVGIDVAGQAMGGHTADILNMRQIGAYGTAASGAKLLKGNIATNVFAVALRK